MKSKRRKRTFEYACKKMYGFRATEVLSRYMDKILDEFRVTFDEPTDDELGLDGDE
jgi:hypothetical protein